MYVLLIVTHWELLCACDGGCPSLLTQFKVFFKSLLFLFSIVHVHVCNYVLVVIFDNDKVVFLYKATSVKATPHSRKVYLRDLPGYVTEMVSDSGFKFSEEYEVIINDHVMHDQPVHVRDCLKSNSDFPNFINNYWGEPYTSW